MQHRDVYFSGMGIVSSIGENISEFKQSLRNGRCGVRNIESQQFSTDSAWIGANLLNFSFGRLLNSFTSLPDCILEKAQLIASREPLSIQSSIISALEAWQSSNLKAKKIDSERIGLFVAGQNSTSNYQFSQHPEFIEHPEYLTPRYALQSLDSNHIGVLSELLDIKGEGILLGGASASGNVAIIKSFQAIQSGLMDVCLVVGVLTDLSPMEKQAFFNIGAMGGKRFVNKPKEACRPFDREHEGFICGQASGCLILEAGDHLKKRDGPRLAQIVGGSMVLDANRLSDPSAKGESRAMKNALNAANLSSSQIDYINAHGTSSPLGDKTEIEAIRKVFGNQVSRIWINSTKSLTGHCMQSAAIVEAIAGIIQMKNDFVHPNLNLHYPIDTECRFCGLDSQPAEINAMISNSFGFGGINTSIAIKRGA